MLIPSLADPCLKLKIWPFSGTLAEFCQPENIVAVETYPAEFYEHLGLSFSFPTRKSKCRQAERQTFASHMLSWADERNLKLEYSLVNAIRDGFGSSITGEDRFDAVVGLYGMINIIQGDCPLDEPAIPLIRNVEGWIFGQSVS